ncbi:hypothetical protein BHM03_00013499 [Ensete ventricosum]|nr:hypothetical protein BHM03_00013499 [Ensete ventricosum]
MQSPIANSWGLACDEARHGGSPVAAFVGFGLNLCSAAERMNAAARELGSQAHREKRERRVLLQTNKA